MVVTSWGPPRDSWKLQLGGGPSSADFPEVHLPLWAVAGLVWSAAYA